MRGREGLRRGDMVYTRAPNARATPVRVRDVETHDHFRDPSWTPSWVSVLLDNGRRFYLGTQVAIMDGDRHLAYRGTCSSTPTLYVFGVPTRAHADFIADTVERISRALPPEA